MTTLEVLQELRSRCKPYIGVMKQSTFSTYLKRIANDEVLPYTKRSFFEKFGYQGKADEWEIIDSSCLVK